MKLEELNLTLKTSISGSKEHSLVYRDDRVGVQMEIHTPVKKGFAYEDPEKFGKARRVFFIDGDNKAYETVEEFQKALEPIAIPSEKRFNPDLPPELEKPDISVSSDQLINDEPDYIPGEEREDG